MAHINISKFAMMLHCSTLCMVGVDAGNAVTPSTGPPTSVGVLYILHMGDGTIPTVRKN